MDLNNLTIHDLNKYKGKINITDLLFTVMKKHTMAENNVNILAFHIEKFNGPEQNVSMMHQNSITEDIDRIAGNVGSDYRDYPLVIGKVINDPATEINKENRMAEYRQIGGVDMMVVQTEGLPAGDFDVYIANDIDDGLLFNPASGKPDYSINLRVKKGTDLSDIIPSPSEPLISLTTMGSIDTNRVIEEQYRKVWLHREENQEQLLPQVTNKNDRYLKIASKFKQGETLVIDTSTLVSNDTVVGGRINFAALWFVPSSEVPTTAELDEKIKKGIILQKLKGKLNE